MRYAQNDLVVQHRTTGERRTVPVEDATEQFTLLVRWPLAGLYAIDVRTGVMRVTARGKRETGWVAIDVPAAERIWRSMVRNEKIVERMNLAKGKPNEHRSKSLKRA